MESYLGEGHHAERQRVFTDVGVLLYVFDVESDGFETTGSRSKDLDTYTAVVRALGEFSPQAKVFAMVHKMDLYNRSTKTVSLRTNLPLSSAVADGFEEK